MSELQAAYEAGRRHALDLADTLLGRFDRRGARWHAVAFEGAVDALFELAEREHRIVAYQRMIRERFADDLAQLTRTQIGRIRPAQRRSHLGDRPSDRAATAYGHVLDGDPCSYCGRVGGLIDHIVPRYTGTDDWDNLTAACKSCNSRKGNRSLLWFLTSGGMSR